MRLDVGRWKEFGLGLDLGLSRSLFVLVWQNDRETRVERAATELPKPEPRAAPAASESEEASNNYSFYDRLSNFEVVVPEKESEVSRDRNDAPAPVERPGVYVLQAGSYRKQEDADRVRALLKKQGSEANVQRVAVDEDVWHRVRIGPITDLTELNRLRARLRAAEFDKVLTIRVGD